MLLELFIVLQILALVTFAVAFFRKSEFFWAFTLVLLGVLIFASYNIQQNVSVVTSQTMIGNTATYEHEIMTKQVTDKTYSYLNMGMFLLALVFFIYDLFINWKENRTAKR